MTPRQVWSFAQRWAWLIILGIAAAAASSYLVSLRIPKVYQSTAEVLVAPGRAGSSGSSYDNVLTGQNLTRTYAQVLKTRPVVDAAAKAIGLQAPYSGLVGLISTTPVQDTQLIQVSARANDPQTAAAFANQLANVFILQTQASQSSRYAASQDALGKEVDQLAADIQQVSGQADQLRTQPASATRDSEIARLQGEITQLQQSYAAAIRSYEDVRVSQAQSTDVLSVVEPAMASSTPVQPRVTFNVLVAALVGLMLALGVAFGYEYFDDRLTSPERLTQLAGLHPLGMISELPKEQLPPAAEVSSGTQPAEAAGGGNYGSGYGYGGASESFRLLYANLQFAAVERPLRTLLITSCDAGDGKSTTAAHLAVVMAQAGQSVLLVDADLRRPTLHTLFEVPNRRGLTSLLVNDQMDPDLAVVTTRFPGLTLLPSGPLPPNPSELLASHRMRARVAELRERADLVILDSPPALVVSDPAVLASVADGTLLVVNAQRTRAQHATQALTTLHQAGARMLGAVINRVPQRARGRYGNYAYYGPKPGATPSPTTP